MKVSINFIPLRDSLTSCFITLPSAAKCEVLRWVQGGLFVRYPTTLKLDIWALGGTKICDKFTTIGINHFKTPKTMNRKWLRQAEAHPKTLCLFSYKILDSNLVGGQCQVVSRSRSYSEGTTFNSRQRGRPNFQSLPSVRSY